MVPSADPPMGRLTDITFSVFHEFYLCGSSIFSPALGRWVPILWTVMRQQREFDFEAHFNQLWSVIDTAGVTERRAHDFMSSVVDNSQYSLAQMEGFKAAFRTWSFRKKHLGALSGTALQAECTELDLQAPKLLKGFGFHFAQSAERIRKNGSFVDVEMRSLFRTTISALRFCRSEEKFWAHLKTFNESFTRCTEWIQRWIRCDIQSMVFPALKLMDQERWDSLPTTTLALESQHAVYYLTFERKMDPLNGLHCLQSLADLLHAEHNAEGEGIKTRYGEQHAVSELRKARKSTYFNDGRAPDVVAAVETAKETKGKPKAAAENKPAQNVLNGG
ncbi:unnamed protein product [Tilletia caries]|nr:unnamed protein product [Tilletia caries]